MATIFKLHKAALILALAAAYPMAVHADAGVAQFASGDVSVRRGATQIALVKGTALASGDSIATGVAGRVQLRFTDGGIVSLQPNSQFDITKYVDANDPKQDGFFVDFVRGSMRAITGLIGKRNRENYKVHTATATIGIRGSGFSASYNTDGSISVSTELDEIEVCTKGGCVRLTAGESCIIVNNDEPPVRTQLRANLPNPPPRQEITVAGNQVTSGGLSAIVSIPTIQVVSAGWQGAFVGTEANTSLPPAPPTTVPYFNQNDGANPSDSDQFTLDGTQLTKWASSSDGLTLAKTSLASYGSAGQVADADFIGWGHWATSDKIDYNGKSLINDMHYVVGKPTAELAIAALSGQTGEYTLLGGTASYSYAGSSQMTTMVGAMSGQLFVDFGNVGGLSGNLTAVFAKPTETQNAIVNISFSADPPSGSARFSSCGNGVCINGIFTGTNASRAGLVFNAPASSSSVNVTGNPNIINTEGTISGSAAFGQTSLTLPPT